MNPASSASISSASLRPRHRRQLHVNDADQSLDATIVPPKSDASPDLSARSASQSLGARHSRPTRNYYAREYRPPSQGRYSDEPGVRGLTAIPNSTASGFWESSWSSLRGLASDLLGGAVSGDSSRASSPRRVHTHAYGTSEFRSGRKTDQWGPALPSQGDLGQGTRERQRAELAARKREKLLVANGHFMPDALGAYKRRESFEDGSTSFEPEEDANRAALVYVHRVKPGDTLAGVLIKYNCQAHVFRRANRLWPNDSIQTRTYVVLPVEACGVRGQKVAESKLSACPSPVTGPADRQAFLEISEQGVIDQARNIPRPTTPPITSASTSPFSSVSQSNMNETQYTHDAWVTIEGFNDPVEIARLSKRAIGYFPRSRRMSRSLSNVHTPMSSLDLQRGTPQSHAGLSTSRSRASSSSYVKNLQGPGGVGSMSRNVRSPGPANDGLNKLFPGLEQRVTVRTEAEDLTVPSFHTSGFENIGSSVEGWVRKLATKASSSLQPSISLNQAGGDLIELSEDAFDLGGDTHAEDSTRNNRHEEFGGQPRLGRGE